MKHWLKTEDGKHYMEVNMYCSHPDLKDNNSENIGCNGRCEECRYGKAELTIKDFFVLADKANLLKG